MHEKTILFFFRSFSLMLKVLVTLYTYSFLHVPASEKIPKHQTDLSLSSPIWIQIFKLQLITFEIYFLYFRCPNISLRTTISFRLNYFFKRQARENPEWFLKIFTELLYQKHVVVKD